MTAALAAVWAPTAVAEAGLLARWPMDAFFAESGDLYRTPEASGDPALVGRLNDSAQILPGEGRFAGALDLLVTGSTGHRVTVANSPALTPPRLTAMAWARSGPPGNFKWLLAKGAGSCDGPSWGFSTGATGELFFVVRDAATVGVVKVAGASVWDGGWHAVAGSYDGTTLRAYLDGRPAGSAPLAGPIAYGLGVTDLNIGNYPASQACGFDYTFPGLLDEVRVYDRALTAAQIAYVQDPAATEPRSSDGTPVGGGGGFPPVVGPPRPGVPIAVSSLAARVEGIEITQATQTIEQPRSTTYDGVALVAGKKTVVRVYADLLGRDPASGRRPPLGMVLTGTDAVGRRKPGSPLAPEWSPDVGFLSLNDPGLQLAERNSAIRAFTFTLPSTWTLGPLRLEARALSGATGGSPPLCLAPSCGATPARTLSGITFIDPPAPIALNVVQQLVVTHELLDPADPKKGPNPSGRVTGINTYPNDLILDATAKLRAMYPVPFAFLGNGGVPSSFPRFRATRFASDTAILEPIQAYDEEIGRQGAATVGLFILSDNPGITAGRASVASVARTSPTELWRPVTSVAHEVLHALGFKHASSSCGAGNPPLSEPWPVANGQLDSVGVDTTPRSGGKGAGAPPYRVIADDGLITGAFDLMSYCGDLNGGDRQHWISARNWTRALGLPPPRRFPRLAGPGTRGVFTVRAQLGPGGARIASIARTAAAIEAPAAPSSFSVVARDAGGGVIASAPATLDRAEGGAGAQPLDLLSAQVPAAGVDRIEILADGAVVAAQDRSPAPPRARVVAPARGARVGESAAVTVRWRASDADGDALSASLDYSSNGGRSFRNVWAGPAAGGVARVPTEYLDASARARLRLRVDDGLNETTAVSAPFAVVRRRPLVRILEPTTGQRTNAGGTIRLHGAAADDRGRILAGNRLRWRAGGEVIARGAVASAALPVGTRRLTLEATDAAGRTGSATVRLRVRATRPFFVRLSAPRTLPRRARSVALVASATQPSALTVRGRRVPVGTGPTRVRVPVPAGRSPLRLRLTLTAGGKSTRQTVPIARR